MRDAGLARYGTVFSSIVLVGVLALPLRVGGAAGGPIGLGREPTEEEIRAWDVAVGPAGRELPPGQGTGVEGARIYASRCASCHGATGREGPDPPLAGGGGTLATGHPLLTIGSFWPYATTVFDYVRRAMPFDKPGSLADDEVYAVTAYLLQLNQIVDATQVIDARVLPAIRMPNRDGFRPDPRPDVRVRAAARAAPATRSSSPP
jgi:S-disulfanyl-L-cysteine oxidoreductase SoxD